MRDLSDFRIEPSKIYENKLAQPTKTSLRPTMVSRKMCEPFDDSIHSDP